MFNTYQNIPIYLNGNYIFALQASVNEQAELNSNYFVSQRHSFKYPLAKYKPPKFPEITSLSLSMYFFIKSFPVK